ncbi:hypothetical protein SAMN02745181_3807 [Rubritalea squalenifaciens DSM 18772]|uniref:Lipoprotein n=2 Tax=Rubritalea squalenifaciens TaxID=407226 RepID=A0A1M6SEK3_9BACT|nr:hypothetical protein SAMN02745181_3807 [Rubritalea squalenifaciens DSM 18772]
MRWFYLLLGVVLFSACSDKKDTMAEWRARAVLGHGPDGVLLHCEDTHKVQGASFSVIGDRDEIMEWVHGKMPDKPYGTDGVEDFKRDTWRLVSVRKTLMLSLGDRCYVSDEGTNTYRVEAVLHYLSTREIKCEVNVLWLY